SVRLARRAQAPLSLRTTEPLVTARPRRTKQICEKPIQEFQQAKLSVRNALLLRRHTGVSSLSPLPRPFTTMFRNVCASASFLSVARKVLLGGGCAQHRRALQSITALKGERR